MIPGGGIIWRRYQIFMRELPQTAEELRLDVEDLIFTDYASVISMWMEKNSD